MNLVFATSAMASRPWPPPNSDIRSQFLEPADDLKQLHRTGQGTFAHAPLPTWSHEPGTVAKLRNRAHSATSPAGQSPSGRVPRRMPPSTASAVAGTPAAWARRAGKNPVPDRPGRPQQRGRARRSRISGHLPYRAADRHSALRRGSTVNPCSPVAIRIPRCPDGGQRLLEPGDASTSPPRRARCLLVLLCRCQDGSPRVREQSSGGPEQSQRVSSDRSVDATQTQATEPVAAAICPSIVQGLHVRVGRRKDLRSSAILRAIGTAGTNRGEMVGTQNGRRDWPPHDLLHCPLSCAEGEGVGGLHVWLLAGVRPHQRYLHFRTPTPPAVSHVRLPSFFLSQVGAQFCFAGAGSDALRRQRGAVADLRAIHAAAGPWATVMTSARVWCGAPFNEGRPPRLKIACRHRGESSLPPLLLCALCVRALPCGPAAFSPSGAHTPDPRGRLELWPHNRSPHCAPSWWMYTDCVA